jgi:uncharacterized membrane protein
MDGPFFLDVISRIVHVSTAIVLVGGSVFSVLVVHPTLAAMDEEQRAAVGATLVGRWKRWVHLGILLFLASGIYNYLQAIPAHKGDGPYHALLGTKMLLALVVFFLASALVGRSSGLQRIRDSRRFWTIVMVALAFVIVAISGFTKVRGIPVPATAESGIVEPNSQSEQPR